MSNAVTMEWPTYFDCNRTIIFWILVAMVPAVIVVANVGEFVCFGGVHGY